VKVVQSKDIVSCVEQGSKVGIPSTHPWLQGGVILMQIAKASHAFDKDVRDRMIGA
jgi:hypothetical protein